jgi:hypothetical protein
VERGFCATPLYGTLCVTRFALARRCSLQALSGKATTSTLRDENGSNTDGYGRYYICFHISNRIRIRIRIVSTMPKFVYRHHKYTI